MLSIMKQTYKKTYIKLQVRKEILLNLNAYYA